jgi:hypothetical protein
LSPYLEGRPHEVSLEISSEETETRLEKLGGQLAELAEALAERAPESEAYRLAERTLREQYAFEPSLEEPSLEGPSSGSSPEEPLGKAAKPTDSEETDSKGAIPETKSGEEVPGEEIPGEEIPGEDGSDDGLSGGSDGSRSDGIKPRPAEDVSAESLHPDVQQPARPLVLSRRDWKRR